MKSYKKYISTFSVNEVWYNYLGKKTYQNNIDSFSEKSRESSVLNTHRMFIEFCNSLKISLKRELKAIKHHDRQYFFSPTFLKMKFQYMHIGV